METKKDSGIKPIKETNESNESNEIEDTMNDMVDKIIEEKDSSEKSYDSDDIEDESFKLANNSTRHQSDVRSTAMFSRGSSSSILFTNFDRRNKRTSTQLYSNSFKNPLYNPNLPGMRNPSFCSLNNNGNNNFFPNIYNNNLGYNNNLNQSFLSNLSFNPRFSFSSFNNNISPNNYFQNNIPFSNNTSNANLGNLLNLRNNVSQQSLFNFANQKHTTRKSFNNNKNLFSRKSDFSIKREENRKKSAEIPFNFYNNLINMNMNNNINNVNNKCYNRNNEEQLANNINELYNNNDDIIQNNSINNLNNDINNTNLFNYNNNYNNYNNMNENALYMNENLIYELKHLLDRTGNIDYNIYNFAKGKFSTILKNHKGSKILQKYLKSVHSDEIVHLIFVELSTNIEELIIDPYANYFCKKFFTYLNQKDRLDFLVGIEKSFIKLSSDSIGTYPIQTIIENLNTKTEKMIIISAIKERFKELIYDPFGCHVLEKLLVCFEDEYISFIYSYIFENFLYLANNNIAICIIKKILSFTNKEKLHEKLKTIVKENAIALIQQPYGNFVIQIIIECWKDYKDIILLFKGYFFKLSLEKYASNVIERCIEKDGELLNNYIDEIVKSYYIHEVMRSNYGNYVIQKAIKLAKNDYKNKLVFNAAFLVNNLKENKLITKWKSILMPHIHELSADSINKLNSRNFFSL